MARGRFYFITLLSFPLLYFCALPCIEGSFDAESFSLQDDAVQLVVGDTKIFSTDTPTRVFINNPDIADIVDVTNTEITVNAQKTGATTLTYFDKEGEQSIKIRVIPEDAQELKYRVDKILETLDLVDVSTQALPEEGRVAILGKINRYADKERMVAALGQLKDKTVDLTQVKEEAMVVEIDVQVLEVDKGSTKNLGFTWPAGVNITEIGSPALTGISASAVQNVNNVSTVTNTQTTTGTAWGTLFKVLNVTRPAFQLTIDALVQEGKARVLSRPRLACQSGKDAELFVGGEKPVFSSNVVASTGSVGTNIDYKQYGIKLKVRPTITDDNNIKLVLNVDVSEIGEAETIGTATTGTITAKAYPLTKRSASTEVFIGDSQTLAIGGLIKQKSEEQITKVPFLGDIPIIGAVFRKKATTTGGGAGQRSNTELFITLTPTIIMTKGLTGPTEEKRASGVLPASSTSAVVSPSDYLRERMLSLMEYNSLVQKRILQNIIYPASAKEAGFGGTVKLSLHISYVGDLMDAEVKDSSGYKILDDNALSAAKAIGLFPPFPASVDLKDIWIEIPIIYKVD